MHDRAHFLQTPECLVAISLPYTLHRHLHHERNQWGSELNLTAHKTTCRLFCQGGGSAATAQQGQPTAKS